MMIMLAAPFLTARSQAAAPVLLPGSPELNLTHLREKALQVRTFRRMAEGDTMEKVASTGRIELHLSTARGAPAILQVLSYEFNGRTFLDTAVFRLRDFAPVWESSRFGGRASRFDYEGPRVSLAITTDSGTRRAEHTYGMPVFNFVQLDLVIQSLRLEEGYERILPLYSEGSDELEMDSVRVVGRDHVGAWTVRFADPAIVSTYTIDGSTRAILHREVVNRKDRSRSREDRTSAP